MPSSILNQKCRFGPVNKFAPRLDVRFGSEADIRLHPIKVGFARKSLSQTVLLSAKTRWISPRSLWPLTRRCTPREALETLHEALTPFHPDRTTLNPMLLHDV
jgi:hypothetical protein